MTVSSQNSLSYLGVKAVNPPNLIAQSRAPSVSDFDFDIGTFWVNTTTGTFYALATVAGTTATWTVLGGAASNINTINTQAPIAGNYTLAGTANQITKTDTAGTTTFSLPAAVTAPGSVTATTSIAATTSITAGTDITATLGNVVINGAAKQLRVHGGAVTDFIGQATLVNGVATVLNTNIAAGDRIMLGRSAVNASTALGVFKTTINAATSFVITACKPADATTETADVSTVDYFIVRQV